MITRLTLRRHDTLNGAIMGTLYAYDEKHLICTFQTLENEEHHIPQGAYTIDYTYSPKFKRYLWLLRNVPDRSEIRLHEGNHKDDTSGCIILGMYRQYDQVLRSKDAFDLLNAIIDHGKLHVLRIYNSQLKLC